ncbi:hypothetical protein BSZ36_05200 [Rubricoccus marinus]|uniref:Uncharacterized protein n=1 Tax=Rubricoccus marinus TaxID=716817 RepID=A0A259TXE1_9BACT|nr:hypothetical protein BSZ36_05200 [Rubricoccus marinus]
MRFLPLLLAFVLVAAPTRAQSTSDEIDADGCPFSTSEAVCIVGAGVAIGVGFLFAPVLCADAPQAVDVGDGARRFRPDHSDESLLQRRGVGVTGAVQESGAAPLTRAENRVSSADSWTHALGPRLAETETCPSINDASPLDR